MCIGIMPAMHTTINKVKASVILLYIILPNKRY